MVRALLQDVGDPGSIPPSASCGAVMQNWVAYLSGEFLNHWAMGYSGAGVSQSDLLKLFCCVEIIKYEL